MASAIIQKVSESFEKAQAAGDLLFFPSTLHTHVEAGIEYQIRLCPALQKKPKLEAPHFVTADEVVGIEHGRAYNPFLPPYVPTLFVGDLDETGEAFVVLLNKFSVVPSHFLMVTRDFQSQASPLLPNELFQAYSLLRSAKQLGKLFFAFYNCGDRSGASQPHKHVQFMPLEGNGPPIESMARSAKLDDEDKPFSLSSLPYANHIRRLPRWTSNDTDLENELADIYMSLLDRVFSTIRRDDTYPSGPPSYNMILTLEHLYLIPRKEETHMLIETGENLSVNSLGFAGMLLVKSEVELEAVKKEGIRNILKAVGVENVYIEDMQITDPA